MVMWESGKINVVSVELSIMYVYTSGPLVRSRGLLTVQPRGSNVTASQISRRLLGTAVLIRFDVRKFGPAEVIRPSGVPLKDYTKVVPGS